MDSAIGTVPESQRTNLTDDEAARLFNETFAAGETDTILNPIPANHEIVAQTGFGTATVETDTGDSEIVTSSEPIAGANSDSPLDLSLEKRGEGYGPSDPAVDVQFPSNSAGSATLKDAAVHVSLQTASNRTSEARELGKGALIYPNIANDTDLVLAPRATGFEVLGSLRSSASPAALRFDLHGPDGSSLQVSPDGRSASVARNGESIATVSPPIAVDAEGKTIDTSLAVDGSTLIIGVKHDSPSTAYPVLLDPAVTDNYAWPSGSPFAGWINSQTDSDYSIWSFPTGSWVPAGLYEQAPGSKTYGGFSNGQSAYYAPHVNTALPGMSDTTAYIKDATFGTANYTVDSGATGNKPRFRLGVWSIDQSGWVRSLEYQTTATTSGVRLGPGVPVQSGMSELRGDMLDIQLFNPGSSSISPTYGPALISMA